MLKFRLFCIQSYLNNTVILRFYPVKPAFSLCNRLRYFLLGKGYF